MEMPEQIWHPGKFRAQRRRKKRGERKSKSSIQCPLGGREAYKSTSIVKNVKYLSYILNTESEKKRKTRGKAGLHTVKEGGGTWHGKAYGRSAIRDWGLKIQERVPGGKWARLRGITHVASRKKAKRLQGKKASTMPRRGEKENRSLRQEGTEKKEARGVGDGDKRKMFNGAL